MERGGVDEKHVARAMSRVNGSPRPPPPRQDGSMMGSDDPKRPAARDLGGRALARWLVRALTRSK